MNLRIIRISKFIVILGVSLGVLNFLLWLFLFEKFEKTFELIGAVLIAVFTILSISQIILLIRDRVSKKELNRDGYNRNWYTALFLLLCNIPICIFLIFLWDWVGKRALVTIENLNTSSVTSIKIAEVEYTGEKVVLELNELKSGERERLLLNKWASHNFDVTITFPDTVITTKLSYYRMFRNQPLIDTLRVNKDYTTTLVSGESRIHHRRMEKLPFSKQEANNYKPLPHP